MKALKYIRVSVTEPFSGGIVKIFDSTLRVLPNIYLHPLQEPTYIGVSKKLADYYRAHRKKDGYILQFTREDLPYFFFKHLPRYEIEGEPSQNVEVDIGVEEI